MIVFAAAQILGSKGSSPVEIDKQIISDLLYEILIEIALIICVDHASVAVNCRSYIVCIPHAAFDLKALNATLDKALQVFRNIPVLR